jgi:drug/metabolite transporter (DMT)-like permease
VLTATLLALAAAVIHAGWNLAIKQSGDRFVALWGQFLLAGLFSAAFMLAVPAARHIAWPFAIASGLVHTPYAISLAKAYDSGDFSVTYPLARGGGALLAAIGGTIVLDDDLTVLGWSGAAIIFAGLVLLSQPWKALGSTVGEAHRRVDRALLWAVAVAVTIATYTIIDAEGSRRSDNAAYALGGFIVGGLSLTAVGLAQRKGPMLAALLRTSGHRIGAGALASMATYAMVLVAVRTAPVGYVAAIRECSVVLAALAGWFILREGHGQASGEAIRRVRAAVVVAVGLIVLVVGR